MQCNTIQYILLCNAFEWDTVEYATRHLYFSVYTRDFRRVCIRRKYKWQVSCSTVSHEKALHKLLYSMPVSLETLQKFLEWYGNLRDFGKLRKRFKNRFLVYTIRKIFGKSSESSDRNFQNNFFKIIKVLKLKFLENLWQCSEIFGNGSKLFYKSFTVQKTFAIPEKFRRLFSEVLKRILAQLAVARK